MRSQYLGKALMAPVRSRRKHGWLWLPLGLVLGGAVGAFLSLRGIPPEWRLWEATSVEVSGARVLLPAEVQRQAGLGAHPSWIFFNSPRARARLLLHPWIASARIVGSPSRVLRLAIQERVPAVLVPHRGTLAELDPSGVLLPLDGGRVAADLPTLTGLDLDTLAFGKALHEPRMLATLEFLTRCRADYRGLWRRISEVRLGEQGVIRLVLAGCSAEVWLRPESAGQARLSLLETVLADVETRAPGARVIDLRFRDQVVVKTAAEAGSPSATHS